MEGVAARMALGAVVGLVLGGVILLPPSAACIGVSRCLWMCLEGQRPLLAVVCGSGEIVWIFRATSSQCGQGRRQV